MDGFLSSLDPEGLEAIIKCLSTVHDILSDQGLRHLARFEKAECELKVILQIWIENFNEHHKLAKTIPPRIDAVCKALEVRWPPKFRGRFATIALEDIRVPKCLSNFAYLLDEQLDIEFETILTRLTLWREQLYANAVLESAIGGGAIEDRPNNVPDAWEACGEVPTIQEIYAFEDPAAHRSEELLSLQAKHDWADNMEFAIRHCAGSDQDGEPIYMYQYKRTSSVVTQSTSELHGGVNPCFHLQHEGSAPSSSCELLQAASSLVSLIIGCVNLYSHRSCCNSARRPPSLHAF